MKSSCPTVSTLLTQLPGLPPLTTSLGAYPPLSRALLQHVYYGHLPATTPPLVSSEITHISHERQVNRHNVTVVFATPGRYSNFTYELLVPGKVAFSPPVCCCPLVASLLSCEDAICFMSCLQVQIILPPTLVSSAACLLSLCCMSGWNILCFLSLCRCVHSL